MRRHDLLAGVHELLQPRTYFEIGVRKGDSLGLSRARSVAVDPFYEVERELWCDLHLVRTTSDEFFAREQPFAHFETPVIDLAFIDGMHLSEYALRDFINTERFCHPGSVVIFDDVLPRSVEEAARDRITGPWAGDVYKVIDTLQELRPDLTVIELDTAPTGTLAILNLAPRNRTLVRAYDDLVADYVTPDPQDVSIEYLQRTRAMAAEDLLAAPIWDTLRAVRSMPPARARRDVRGALLAAGLTTGDAA
ncbi:MAG: class I SAM-dependent methyltransferase [Nocardioides sp.]|uniref:class I SAM-dependent methyltransferase n=1 Tax=Nocardioides sp. TaxID=35761 RepID=UPI0039E56D7C